MSSQPNTVSDTHPIKLWPLLLATGVGAGLASGLLMKLLRSVQHLAFHYSSGDFLEGVRQSSSIRRVVVLLLAGIVTAVGLYLLRRFTRAGADPTAAVWNKNGDLPVAASFCRAVLSITIVGMGTALGREAALKQAGAAVAAKLSYRGRLNPEERKLLVACGAGAGMAAAYNVPLGGALFAAEVLLGSLSLPVLLPVLVTSFTATATSWLMLPNQPTYDLQSLPVSGSLLLWALLAGPLLGLGAAMYVRAIGWVSQHRPQGWRAFALPVIVISALGGAAVWHPEVLGNGKNVVQLLFDNQLPVSLLGALLVLRPLATVLCLWTAAPGGLFTPTMSFGALLGAATGQLWSHVSPGCDKRSFALIGAGALLAAAAQAPLSSVVFLVELTHHADSMMVPLLIASAGALLTLRRFETRSIYSARV